MTYLIKRTDQYRSDTEAEAKNFIEQQKKSNEYEVIKYSSEAKQTKAKGEVVDGWMRVIIVKQFDDEKEPTGSAENVSYEEDEE